LVGGCQKFKIKSIVSGTQFKPLTESDRLYARLAERAPRENGALSSRFAFISHLIVGLLRDRLFLPSIQQINNQQLQSWYVAMGVAVSVYACC